MPVWNPKGAKVFVQPDGPGNPYYFTDPETDMDAIGGGSRSYASDYGGDGTYIGSRVTGNPGDVSGTLTSRRYDTASRLRDLAESGCFLGLLAVNGCSTLDAYDFDSAQYLTDVGFTSYANTTGRTLDRMAGANDKVLDSLPFRAGRLSEWRRLGAGRIATTVAATMRSIIPVGNQRCAGCGVSNDGNKEFIATSGAVSPSTVPRIYYTADGGLTWKSCTLTGVTSGVAESVTKIGDNLLIAVSGASSSVWRVSYTTLKSAATTTAIAATAATGITIGAGSFWEIRSAGNTVLACGNTGQVWISRDRGYSFTQLNHGLTVATLLGMAMYDENTAYFAGETNAMLVYKAGVFSLVTLPVTATEVAVPPRPDEIYFNDPAATTGLLYRSRDGLQTFEIVPYANVATSAISQIQFVGSRGELLFFMTTNTSGSPFTSLYVDRSGGAGGAAVQLLRTTALTGGKFVMSSPNYGLLPMTSGGATASYFERISG